VNKLLITLGELFAGYRAINWITISWDWKGFTGHSLAVVKSGWQKRHSINCGWVCCGSLNQLLPN